MLAVIHIPTGLFVKSWFFGPEPDENSIHVRLATFPSSPDNSFVWTLLVLFSWDKIYVHRLVPTNDLKMPEVEEIFEASSEEFDSCPIPE